MNEDFRDLIRALSDAEARFLVVGAYAVSVHAEPRATGDLGREGIVFQIGLPPRRIDLLTGITGVVFSEAWPRRVEIEDGDLRFAVIGREELIRNKRALGRPKDLLDVALLERHRR